ncbi:hypothetical protein [Streptomyces sp. NPDC002265]|uniref:hypothetical protein n=1 Tax=Streptomyces sp. NPDC002265 TaxID=3154415 RepID=UPI003324E178
MFRSATKALLAVVAALGMVLAANGPAMAADVWKYYPDGDGWEIDLVRDGTPTGYGVFNADPQGVVNPIPGDAFQACDTAADGKGIEIQRKFTGGSWTVMATTRGHSVVGDSYCTFWETDNMPEETLLQVRVCIVQGEHSTCSEAKYSYA